MKLKRWLGLVALGTGLVCVPINGESEKIQPKNEGMALSNGFKGITFDMAQKAIKEAKLLLVKNCSRVSLKQKLLGYWATPDSRWQVHVDAEEMGINLESKSIYKGKYDLCVSENSYDNDINIALSEMRFSVVDGRIGAKIDSFMFTPEYLRMKIMYDGGSGENFLLYADGSRHDSLLQYLQGRWEDFGGMNKWQVLIDGRLMKINYNNIEVYRGELDYVFHSNAKGASMELCLPVDDLILEKRRVAKLENISWCVGDLYLRLKYADGSKETVRLEQLILLE